ncbi:MAG TPA: 8-oxoguanine deaminase [Actinopolymorphaceae bacterium]|nr:8-oxoguanine deaminase [Actinopolymorphaceae bacterium]
MNRLVIENAAVATVDAVGTEHPAGHVVIERGRIAAVGPGPAAELAAGTPAADATAGTDATAGADATDGTVRIDGSGCLATPGLVNTHHHLYQWLTRGLATDATLFEWLVALYPVWARLDGEAVRAATRAGLGWLALSGCTTTTDHHYVFPAGTGDLFGVEVAAAREIGLRFHPARGSMDLGQSAGGLPPDQIVEDLDAILSATQDAIDRWHDQSYDSMTRVAVAPCSPFSVTTQLLREAATLARDSGVRLHTHLAETLDEAEYCRAHHGCDPVEYLDALGWLGPDVWLAHAIHLDERAVKRLGETGTAVAHCPSSNARLGAGSAPVRALLDAGVAVGLGVDGPASQESGMLVEELRQALYTARLRSGGGPSALSARVALELGTMGGARCLGRDGELGSLEVGKLADVALWDLRGLGHAGIDDPVAALVLGPPAPLRLLTVGGVPVVEDGTLRTADVDEVVADARAASHRLLAGGADR